MSEKRRLDTIARRWERLEPHVAVHGPSDDLKRPAVILFHGCGGVRSHLAKYADAAKDAGVRAFIVDSYAPRHWGPEVGLGLVCTGAIFRGYERAGDIAASVAGITQRSDVDASRIALAGWSHGGWGIMELMTAPLDHADEIGLHDASSVNLSGVRSAFLAYSYIGFLATRRMTPWRRFPQTLAVIPSKDHLSSVGNAKRVYQSAAASGAPVETWIADATHSFDEPLYAPPMWHHPTLAREAIERFQRLLETTLFDAEPAPARREA
jgi:dienelactone hydrolase